MSTERETMTLEQVRKGLRHQATMHRAAGRIGVGAETDAMADAIAAHLAREKAEPVYEVRDRTNPSASWVEVPHDQLVGFPPDLFESRTLYTHPTAPTTQPSEVHGLKITDDLADYLWWVLDHYANASTYHGKRIGGVLQGCPRGPEPTADDLTLEASIAKKRLKAAYEATHPTAPAEANVAKAEIQKVVREMTSQQWGGFETIPLRVICEWRDRLSRAIGEVPFDGIARNATRPPAQDATP